MKEHIREQFIKTLQKGRFLKGRFALRRVDPKTFRVKSSRGVGMRPTGPPLYCALGVLCELYNDDRPRPIKWASTDTDLWTFDGEDSNVPTDVRIWAGLTDSERLQLIDLSDSHTNWGPIINYLIGLRK